MCWYKVGRGDSNRYKLKIFINVKLVNGYINVFFEICFILFYSKMNVIEIVFLNCLLIMVCLGSRDFILLLSSSYFWENGGKFYVVRVIM